jgi:protein-S-isoprenylcysteine O-methyltransferase Ste14
MIHFGGAQRGTMNYSSVIIFLWLAFYIYWFASAIGVKKNARRNRAGLAIRFVVIAVLFVLFAGVPAVRRFAAGYIVSANPVLIATGVILCVLGLALAVWARVYLGRNWGMPMSLKEGPELVTSGPYRFVRHPIYSGILLALAGSTLAAGSVWLILFVVFGAYFIYSARVEEGLMMHEFPDAYAAYKKRTKVIVPFVW